MKHFYGHPLHDENSLSLFVLISCWFILYNNNNDNKFSGLSANYMIQDLDLWHICFREPAQTGIYLHNTENSRKFTHYAVKQVNKMSNKVHSKVKHNSLELSCSLYSQAQVLVSCVPSSTMFSASFLYACGDPLFLLEQAEKVCLCANMQELISMDNRNRWRCSNFVRLCQQLLYVSYLYDLLKAIVMFVNTNCLITVLSRIFKDIVLKLCKDEKNWTG